jgi:hypothetical protein
MQLIQPGKFMPPNMLWVKADAPELPEDLTIQIRKHGKEPAEIEVKKGDKTWNVKQDDLKSLPDDVREHVEHMLGRGPMRFAVVAPGGGKKFTVPVPAPPDFSPEHAPQTRERERGNLERRIEELSRDMERMRERMHDLRDMLHKEVERDKD